MSKTTPEQMTQTMIDNMPEKTGKSMQQWLQIVAKSGLAKHGEIVKKLKAEFGMGHGFANLVAHTHLAEKSPARGGDDLVGAQYEGPKEGLRPIYDAVTKMVSAFGKDVEVSPKKTYVT
jgi:hypothetical protein